MPFFFSIHSASLSDEDAKSFLRVKRGFFKRITGEERKEERKQRAQWERNREAGERNREHAVKLDRYLRKILILK